MTLTEWITLYESRAEPFIPLPNFLTYFSPDKGFFLWKVTGDAFEIDHTCTSDAHHMNKIANEMAKIRGCRLIRTATFRDPAAYMRFMKCVPNLSLSGIRPNGKFYWVMERLVK